ncbi:MAG: hypothetical protein QM765_27030 [Myxococcales bacterium]
MNARDLRHLLAVLFTLSALALTGCPSAPAGPDASLPAGPDATGVIPDATPVEPLDAAQATPDSAGWDCTGRDYCCVRDEAKLAERTRCNTDLNCPCGAHCQQGLCAFECKLDSECFGGAGWCDALGRCRKATETLTFGGARGGKAAGFEVSPHSIPLMDFWVDVPVSVKAVGQALGVVRVESSAGVLVSCADAQFSSECSLPSVAVGADVRVMVRVEQTDGGFALPEGAGLVRFHSGDEEQRVSISRAEQARFTAPTPGVYQGRLWLAGSRIRLLTDQPLAPAVVGAGVRALEVPLTVKSFADGTLVFADASGSDLLPSGWTFRVHADGKFDALDGAIDRSRHAYRAAGTPGATTATEVAISASGAVWTVGEGLSGSLLMVLDGLGQLLAGAQRVDEREYLIWQFALSRTGELPAGETPPALGGGTAPAFVPEDDRIADPLPWQTAVLAYDPGGVTVANKAQRYLCYGHGGSATAELGMYFSESDLTASGDLKCANGASAFPLFTTADRGLTLEPRQLLASCLAELGRFRAGPPSTSRTGPALLDELSGCGTDGCSGTEMPKCVDAPLFVGALATSIDSIHREGDPDLSHWTIGDPLTAQLSLRLLQQWLQVHTFVAREASQESDPLLGNDPASLAQALELSLAGWDLVLHPRVAARLMHLSPELLAFPDYRGGNVPGGMTEDQTQKVGMPVVMLETLRAQLEAATELCSRARFSGTAVPAQASQALRTAAVVLPLSLLLEARAEQAGFEPPWERQWKNAQESFAHALAGLMREWHALQSGENPLGITEDDLPLYRGLFDPSAAGVRFSAISSFLTGTSGWATNSVAAAKAAKTTAQEAWTHLLERQLQGETLPDRADRIEEIQRSYGEKLLSLCGNPLGYDSTEVLEKWTDLSGGQCFVALNRPECAFDEKSALAKLTMDDVGYQLCLMSEMRNQLGTKVELNAGYVNGWVEQINKAYQPSSNSKPGIVQNCYGYWDPIVNLGTEGYKTFQAALSMVDGIQKGQLQQVPDLTKLKSVPIPSTVDGDAYAAAVATCSARLPDARDVSRVLSEDAAPNSPDCYQGSIGELVLAARAAAADVDTASRRVQDHLDRYQAQMWKCTIDDKALELTQSMSDELDDLETESGRVGGVFQVTNTLAKSGMSILFTTLASVLQLQQGSGDGSDGADTEPAGKGIGEALDAIFPDAPTKLVEVGTAITGTLCDYSLGFFAKEADTYTGAATLREQHAKFMADIKDRLSDAKCFHDAEMELHRLGDRQQRRAEEQDRPGAVHPQGAQRPGRGEPAGHRRPPADRRREPARARVPHPRPVEGPVGRRQGQLRGRGRGLPAVDAARPAHGLPGRACGGVRVAGHRQPPRADPGGDHPRAAGDPPHQPAARRGGREHRRPEPRQPPRGAEPEAARPAALQPRRPARGLPHHDRHPAAARAAGEPRLRAPRRPGQLPGPAHPLLAGADGRARAGHAGRNPPADRLGVRRAPLVGQRRPVRHRPGRGHHLLAHRGPAEERVLQPVVPEARGRRPGVRARLGAAVAQPLQGPGVGRQLRLDQQHRERVRARARRRLPQRADGGGAEVRLPRRRQRGAGLPRRLWRVRPLLPGAHLERRRRRGAAPRAPRRSRAALRLRVGGQALVGDARDRHGTYATYGTDRTDATVDRERVRGSRVRRPDFVGENPHQASGRQGGAQPLLGHCPTRHSKKVTPWGVAGTNETVACLYGRVPPHWARSRAPMVTCPAVSTAHAMGLLDSLTKITRRCAEKSIPEVSGSPASTSPAPESTGDVAHVKYLSNCSSLSTT